MRKLYCYKKRDFDELVAVKFDPEATYVSICGTPGKTREGVEEHALPNLPNVLNIRFDDCTEITKGEDGVIYTPITKEQAEIIVDFLCKSEGDIYVHCLAGKCRSQAVVRFCLDVFPERGYVVRSENPPLTPNPEVLRLLKRVYRIRFYEDSYGDGL